MAILVRGANITIDGTSAGCLKSITVGGRVNKYGEDDCINNDTDQIGQYFQGYSFDDTTWDVELDKTKYSTYVACLEDAATHTVVLTFRDGSTISQKLALEKCPVKGASAQDKWMISPNWKVIDIDEDAFVYVPAGSSMALTADVGLTATELLRG